MKGIKLFALAVFSIGFLSFAPPPKKIIVIDAGHGGNDIGARRDGLYEKEITLQVAKEIQKYNENQDAFEVVLTRDSDNDLSLSERVTKINELQPEMVISLHINSSPQQETSNAGPEIYTQNSHESKKLAEKISTKFAVRGIQEKNLHILRESKVPAVLVELGFINNTQDRNYISSEKGRKEIAQKFTEVFSTYN
ncbi:N-acetylmuramoyl-L-alanine amidase [Chryseobacterium sp. SSA4.19]|uniref:N-acetylmuramoyl-L-alanine amidase family protein n=1 Tax=Chryseobacterium sp. SSA4.19 TaxID=2919915 RepID=UPI001F4E4E08|nr:N-acetylmuramoyl-L-alanine amidase [Chryseobacterium sp. SSA4.19]MCJ8152291.1 N-acetylmuramoyl-L-alanine amidase [Chryseobacterium sp. SSA4.19]